MKVICGFIIYLKKVKICRKLLQARSANKSFDKAFGQLNYYSIYFTCINHFNFSVNPVSPWAIIIVLAIIITRTKCSFHVLLLVNESRTHILVCKEHYHEAHEHVERVVVHLLLEIEGTATWLAIYVVCTFPNEAVSMREGL